MAVTWLTAFLDFDPVDFDAGVSYWRDVTGYGISRPRGDDGEFASLLPPSGDPFLRVQRLGAGPGGVHLDVHAPGQEFEVRRSPGGLPYCLVPGAEGIRPEPVRWESASSLVDQVCLDIPPHLWEAECGFWAGLTGWELDQGGRAEFRRLRKPDGQPVNVLLQRLDDTDADRVTAHADLAATNRDAEAQRHQQLGGTVVHRRAGWTVMRDPVGTTYCITDRRPWAEDETR